ncbi:Conserved hypothetical protein CHP00255 [Spirochaeta thermophila DSM 6578]|uniref:YicC family protein n=1 Tax=Winmispira thermophila (strain ATCC 700085 / DSM 6578 / Z-1203) TaxID=869211 RepID=G0GEX0_WINT7|nr:YicC/YloC family endoribonuclease [Spirochaeta thermophila]AEJ61526.1 Conserved hypothetical protein CHP00255 [Spirochaeta thermophila DSM 6578]
MRSMTGYAYREHTTDEWNLSIELKGYNNRFLELYVNIPSYVSPLEPRIRERLTAEISRGKVECYLRMREYREQVEIHLDEAAVDAYVEALNRLKKRAKVKGSIRLEHLLGLNGLIKVEKLQDPERYWQAVSPLLDAAIADFKATREREGQKTKEHIEQLLREIEEAFQVVKAHAGEMEAYLKAQLEQRMRELVGEGIDEQRLLTELAVLLTRFSIDEEIVRLDAHLSHFRELFDTQGPVGKKMDFLCQEMHREVNTIGSKTPLVVISQAVVRMKDAVENIREQVRNIE